MALSRSTTAYSERIEEPEAVIVVDIGDEFTIPFPETFAAPAHVVDPIFVRWLQRKMNLSTPLEAGCDTWTACQYMPRALPPTAKPAVVTAEATRRRFYLSGLFARDWVRNRSFVPLFVYK